MNELPRMLTVSELNRSVRQLLERNFPLSWVAGEISNLTRAASGHWYFSLKDREASVRCAMFRQKNQAVDWIPQDGMQVEARVLPTLYEARGEFQLLVEFMRRAGQGALFEAFVRLKEKLAAEGLFDPARKRPLPAFPRHIGVVSSTKAAALRDVLKTLERRMPAIRVTIYPTPVQGEDAPLKIAAALAAAGRAKECDLLILARGGGSIEDIAAFNSEIVARAIASCPIPVVSGVGHETDFTIADFAADRRAPTPTAAAEMASPDREELLHRLSVLKLRLARSAMRSLAAKMLHLDHLEKRLLHPLSAVRNKAQHLDHLEQRLQGSLLRAADSLSWRLRHLEHRLQRARPDMEAYRARLLASGDRLCAAMAGRIGEARGRLLALDANLGHLNPEAVLARGFGIVENSQGKILRSAGEAEVGEELKITLAQGWLEAEVISAAAPKQTRSGRT